MLPNTTSCGAGAEAVCGGGLGLRVCNRYFWRTHDPPFVSTDTFIVLTNCTKNVELLLKFGLYQHSTCRWLFTSSLVSPSTFISSRICLGVATASMQIKLFKLMQCPAYNKYHLSMLLCIGKIALTTFHFEENFPTKPFQTPTTTC
jgi:hypothetical protein